MKCKKCGEQKAPGEMAKYAGEPTDICKACRWGKETPKAKPAADAPPAEAAPAVPRNGAAQSEIVVEASLGFAAKIDGDSLVITQANASRENDDDNITLTRAEAKRLFDSFGEWIVGAA